MRSERLFPVLLALLVLAAVAPLSAGLASSRGEKLVIERLVALNPTISDAGDPGYLYCSWLTDCAELNKSSYITRIVGACVPCLFACAGMWCPTMMALCEWSNYLRWTNMCLPLVSDPVAHR